MTPLEQQFEILSSHFPRASIEHLSNGTAVIAIPEVPLPPGWSKQRVTVRFVVPAGYPFAKPDCFWTDADLRLASGAAPQSTGANPIPGAEQIPLTWFSWHLAQWNPNRDSLITYLYGIRGRFRNVQ